MNISIVDQGSGVADGYCAVPIAYSTRSRLALPQLREGTLSEVSIEPRIKDYDLDPEDRVDTLNQRFDTSQWRTFAAVLSGVRVGGVVVATCCPGFELLDGRNDLALIADIRVAPHARGRGVGRELAEAARSWAKAKGCTEMRVETQDINVGACRFYKAMGFELHKIDEHAYPGLDEAQILWRILL
jgi:ribosomal protein S18 acetylase RimI-like enzyme